MVFLAGVRPAAKGNEYQTAATEVCFVETVGHPAITASLSPRG
jgi:hypothetical protein